MVEVEVHQDYADGHSVDHDAEECTAGRPFSGEAESPDEYGDDDGDYHHVDRQLMPEVRCEGCVHDSLSLSKDNNLYI